MSKHDRAKSGGILDTLFFGRPNKKYGGKNNYGGHGTPRPVSSDAAAESQYQQALKDEIDRMTLEEVNAKFFEILEDMNIPDDKRKPLLEKVVKDKKEMILMHLKGKISTEHRANSKFEKPHDYIQYLKDAEQHSPTKIYQCMESLRVALTSNPISWIKEFGEDGIDEVVSLLGECKKRRGYDKIEYECVRCLKAVLNNSWGLNVVLNPDQHAAVLLLAESLNPHKPQTMCEAVKLLAGICLVKERNGYEKVLRAITNASARTNLTGGDRFKPIVDGLFVEYELEMQDRKNETKGELCYNTLIFTNAIINTPSDINFRLHLRCEMMRAGLYEKLELLKTIVDKSNNENLEKHFKIFNAYREDDFEEFSTKFDNVRLELDDINDCFDLLKNLISDTQSEPYFLSILQHLLFIRDDHVFRPAYYKLIEECVSQIVLHKSGCDPNFKSRDFHIDTAMLLDELVERNRQIEMKKSEEYERKMEELQSAKMEADAKAAHLEEKLREIEATGVVGKSPKSKLPQINIPPPPPPPPVMGGMGPRAPGPPPPPMPGMAFRAPGPPPPPMPGMGPPPPPMPGMGPPPPMMMMGMNRLPAPMPAKLPHGLKPKKKWDIDGPPLKRANWKAIVPQKMSEKSFWVKVQEDKLASDEILSGLAAKFSSKPPPSNRGGDGSNDKDSVDRASGKKSIIALRVLDAKAAQNLSILLGGSLKHMTYEHIKINLLRCDTTVLGPSVLQQLIQYLPPPDQLKRLQELKAKREELSGAEMFAATIADVKRLGARLQSLNFKLNMPDMVQDVKPDIVSGTAACDEVKNSKKFAKVLELILLMGNYMNSGSRNEAAFGFEISFLPKLTSTKDFENKQTLLHYIAEVVEAKFPEALTFYEDIPHVDKASRVSLDNIQKTMRQMNNSLKNLESDLNNNKIPQSDDDKFMEVMGKFASECRQQVEVMGRMLVQMETLFKELSEYYCFDPVKYTMEEFFTDIKLFKDAFIQAHSENVKLREAEEKSRRVREAKEQAQRDLLERQQQRKLALVDIDAAQTQEGVMDSLLLALQTGSAFGNRDQRRKQRGPRPAGAERRAQLNRSRSRTGITANAFSSREMLSELLGDIK